MRAGRQRQRKVDPRLGHLRASRPGRGRRRPAGRSGLPRRRARPGRLPHGSPRPGPRVPEPRRPDCDQRRGRRRGLWPREPGPSPRSDCRARRARAQTGRASRQCREGPVAPLGRAAAARLHRRGPGHGAAASGPGRAVSLTRRARARLDPARDGATARGRDDPRPRDALHGRGASRRPRHRDEPRQDRPFRHARPGLLREEHPAYRRAGARASL